jgi:ATP-dependent Zn protease
MGSATAVVAIGIVWGEDEYASFDELYQEPEVRTLGVRTILLKRHNFSDRRRVGTLDAWYYVSSWFPILLLIGLWVYFLMRKPKPVTAILQNSDLDAITRLAAALERLAVVLEKERPDHH